MRTLALLAFALFVSNNAIAQCSFTPTVTPASPILCPNETATLSTEPADSYQWYRDGNLISGATQQTFDVSSSDAGYSYSVESTISGCSEMSASVLVDSWMFLLPFAMTDGTFTIGSNGEAFVCSHDTAYLIAMSPYTVNLQWYLNGSPISGATGQSHMILQSGLYHFSGAPATCPNYIQQLGVQVEFVIVTPPVPVVSANGNLLSVTPSGYDYQWYLNGNPISGANSDSYPALSGGIYTVILSDTYSCSDTSAAYNHTMTSIGDFEPEKIQIILMGDGNYSVKGVLPNTQIDVFDLVGKKHFSGQSSVFNLAGATEGIYLVRLINAENNDVKTLKIFHQ
jgi:hypothetical protein